MVRGLWFIVGRMILRNLKNNQVICEDLKVCRSFWDRSLGLLNPRNPRNLMLNTRFGIHTFFLKHNTDIVILNDKKQVVKLRHNLKPWRMFFWDPSYSSVLELEAGSILKFRVAIGDTLSMN